jgi:hypothetical protein
LYDTFSQADRWHTNLTCTHHTLLQQREAAVDVSDVGLARGLKTAPNITVNGATKPTSLARRNSMDKLTLVSSTSALLTASDVAETSLLRVSVHAHS